MSDVVKQLTAALHGRYAIQRELGRGGMAAVYLAEDRKHRRFVAIKVLHPELGAALWADRFLREIRVTAGLTHPHILPLLDSGEADGLLYYVMPYAEGQSLRERLADEKQLPLGDALGIAEEVARALAHAHRSGVVHRDVKPDNVLLVGGQAVVADFGIARAVVAAGAERLTQTGLAMGTPAYMSPEQASGTDDVDGRSDVYSLGCVLYEMLAGQPPFTGATMESVILQHLTAGPPAITAVRAAVPAPVGVILERALAKTPADRHQTAHDLAEELAAARTGSGPMPAVPRRGPGRRVAAWVGAGIALALAGMLVATHTDLPLPGGGFDAPSLAERSWILVAEFDGPSDDPALGVTASELIGAALDQSGVVVTVPRENVRAGLRLAHLPDTIPVTGEIAREIAFRSGIRSVVHGSVRPAAGGYVAVARVLDSEDGTAVFSATQTAAGPDDLVPALDRLGRDLRRGLGERPEALLAARPLTEITTPSFDAYRLWMRGADLTMVGEWPAALALFREALEHDPDFGGSWEAIGVVHMNLGRLDSARAAFDEARALEHRFTNAARAHLRGLAAFLDADFETAVRELELAVQQNPQNVYYLNNYGVALRADGKHEASLEAFRRAASAVPLDDSPLSRRNAFHVKLSLGRLDEARDALDHLESPGLQHEAELSLALAAGEWARVDSLAQGPASDVPLAALARAAARAATGAVREADRLLAAAGRGGLEGRLLLRMASEDLGGVPVEVAVEPNGDAGAAGLAALAARVRRDRADVARHRATLMAAMTEPPALYEPMPAVVDAALAATAGRWEEVVEELAPWVEGHRPRRWLAAVGWTTAGWMLADAYEELGRADAAAHTLERLVAPEAPGHAERVLRGLIVPSAHLRLVELYDVLERPADARRHRQALEALLTEPDPEVGSSP